jgi:hypothetical protein
MAEMFKARVRFFGATLESVFPKPIPLGRVGIEDLAEGLLDGLSPIGLTPDQLVMIKMNDLFSYELRFPLFRGSASFSLNSKRLRLEFTNAVGPADVTTIIDTVLKCLKPMDLPIGTKHFLNVGRQAEFESPGDFDEFFSPSTRLQSHAVKQAGAIVYLKLPEWPEEVTVTLDRSIVIPSGVFVDTRTILKVPESENANSKQSKALSADIFRKVTEIFESAISECNLELAWPS